MIGLGVLATGSGATALTGATLTNTVSPTADFRVNVDTADLIVKRGPKFGNGDQPVSSELGDNDGSATYVDGPASSDLDGKTGFTAAANTEANSSLDFGALIPFDAIPTSDGTTSASGDVEYRFPDMLQIDNKDNEKKDVVIQYAKSIDGSGAAQSPNGYVDSSADGAVDGTSDFGSALVSEAGDDTDQLSYDEVAFTYAFEFDDTSETTQQERISPNGAHGDSLTDGNDFQTPNRAMSLPAADNSTTPSSAALDFVVSLNNNIGDKIASFVSTEGLDADGGTIRLVDTIYVAETENVSADTNNASPVEPTTLSS